MERIYDRNINQKKASLAILILDKIAFKTSALQDKHFYNNTNYKKDTIIPWISYKSVLHHLTQFDSFKIYKAKINILKEETHKFTTKGEISNKFLSITDGKQTHTKIRKAPEDRTQITLI